MISNHGFFPVLPLHLTIIDRVELHIIRARTVFYNFFLLLLVEVSWCLGPGALNMEQLSDLV